IRINHAGKMEVIRFQPVVGLRLAFVMKGALQGPGPTAELTLKSEWPRTELICEQRGEVVFAILAGAVTVAGLQPHPESGLIAVNFGDRVKLLVGFIAAHLLVPGRQSIELALDGDRVT